MLIPSNTWNNSQATSDYFTQIRYDKNGNILNLLRNGYDKAQLEMDDMFYFYENIASNASNRLMQVKDLASDYSGYDDIKNSGSDYKYNKIGELINDDGEAMSLRWRLGDHKLKSITRTDQNSPNVEFIYNPLGVRVAKISKSRSGGVKLGQEEWKVTYYTYDANGQLMATYDSELYKGAKRTILGEQYIYGSKRVGVLKANQIVYDDKPIEVSTSPKKENILGKKRYELTNHLGNVLATITDRKTYNPTEEYCEPVITMKADYYAFGMLQPGRFEGISEDGTRHLFNGMEHDMEVSGDGNSYTTEFRQYDPRLGRWKSLDPLMKKYPNMSPYVAFNNNPIYFTDPLGLEGETPKGGGDNTRGWRDEGGDSDHGNRFYNPEGGDKSNVQVYDDVDIIVKRPPDSPLGKKTRIERKFERKFERWESRNQNNIMGLTKAERYEQFALSSRWGGRSNMEKSWFKKYENHLNKSNTSTGWNFRTTVHRDNTDVRMNDSGRNSLTVNEDVGESKGELQINYNMAGAADRLQVIDPNTNQVLFDTADLPQSDRRGKVRFSNGSGTTVPFDLGEGNTILRVVVNPGESPIVDPLSGGTVFGYNLVANPEENTIQQSGETLKPE